jgi:transcriptional regulator with PAS, ATPase and Fis domain
LGKTAQKYQVPVKLLADEIERLLVVYQWPGNVRELERLMEALMIRIS